jgi:hypothetical protein
MKSLWELIDAFYPMLDECDKRRYAILNTNQRSSERDADNSVRRYYGRSYMRVGKFMI